MDKQGESKRSFSWRKYACFAVLLAIIIKIAWQFPRTNWSLKPQSPTSSIDKNPGSTSSKDISHVVLISIDTCRADHLGCYNYSRKITPNIDAVAAEGVLFNHAVSPVPITLPAHSSMLTGTVPLYHKVRDNNNYRLAERNVTLAEILKDNGFATGAVVGSFVVDSQFGLDQGFDFYDDQISKGKKALYDFNERKAEYVTIRANEWLGRNRKNKSFLFIHYFDLHGPYIEHEGFIFSSLPFVGLLRDQYDSELAYTDYHIGRVLKKLRELKIYDSTLLIITSDHGECLGQHHETSHGFTIYNSAIHVPLIVKGPGWTGGKIIYDTVGLIDIVPTVCGSLGIPVPSPVQGTNLNYILNDQNNTDEKRYYYCESLTPTKFGLGPFLGLVSDNWKYIHTSEPELYDLEKDPGEIKNLLKSRSQQASLMRDKLKSILNDSGSNTVTDSKTAIDEETRNRLLSLGYVADRTVDETKIYFAQKALNPSNFIEIYDLLQQSKRFVNSGQYAKAKKLCIKILKEWPEMKSIHYLLGEIAIFEKDSQTAIKHFSLYLELTAQDSENARMRIEPASEIAECHFNLGMLLAFDGRFDDAVEHYQKARKMFHELGQLKRIREVQRHLMSIKAARQNPTKSDTAKPR